MITVSVFGWVPDFARGLVRDLRVRWALEEVGLAYEEQVIDARDKQSDAYLAYRRDLQPFGQVPAYREGDLTLFESGGIVHHIAQKSPQLMPQDPAAAARVTSWMFCALNSVEPPIQELTAMDLFHVGESWAKGRRDLAEKQVRGRLDGVAERLGDADYLEGVFSAADILMVSVLRILRHTDILDGYSSLTAYKERCEGRPAFAKALSDQLATFDRSPSA
jgi:glutathione S-transferase